MNSEERHFKNEFYNHNETLKRLVTSVAIGVFLEVGTLKGARVASVLRIEDWRPVRLAIFVGIVFMLITLYAGAKTIGCVRGLRKTALATYISIRSNWKSLLISSSVAVIGSIIAIFISTALYAAVDLRIVLLAYFGLLSISLIISNWSYLNKNIEYLFLVIAIPLAVTYTYLMPWVPEISWDGQIHFSNAVRLSYLVDAEFTKADLLMSNMYAVSELDLVGAGEVESLWHPKQDSQSIELATHQITELDSSSDITVCDGLLGPSGEAPLSVASIGVLPHALGLWFGRLFGLSIIGRLLLARLTSAFAYIVIVFYGIKSLKYGKLLASSLALLITPFMMSTCFSYDPWCYAFVLSAVCHIVGKLQTGNRSISEFDFWVISCLLLLGSFVKAVYFPLYLTLVFMPSSYFSHKSIKTKSMRIVFIAMLILCASFALPTLISSLTGSETVDTRAESGVSASGQIKFAILHFPFFLWIIFRFIIEYLITTPITASIGSYFTYLYNTPNILGYLAWLIILGTVFLEFTRHNISVQFPVRVSAAAGVLASTFLSVCALYASFTPVGEETVYGFQWRYLIPFYPFIFMLVLNPSGITHKFSQKEFRFKYMAAVWVLLELIYQSINIYNGFIVAF